MRLQHIQQLLLFDEFSRRDKLMISLRMYDAPADDDNDEDGNSAVLSGVTVREYHPARDSPVQRVLAVGVIRTPDGPAGFAHKVQRVLDAWGGSSASVVLCSVENHVECNTIAFAGSVIYNPRALEFMHAIGIAAAHSDELYFQLAHALAPASVARTLFPALQPSALAQPPASDPAVGYRTINVYVDSSSSSSDADDNDADEESRQLHDALRASLLDYERNSRMRIAPPPTVAAPPPPGWEAILKAQSDAIVAGQPECVVCCDKRASICFVECGHQVACDECVRTLWTRTDLRHECPCCRMECKTIVRPIVSSVSSAAETREPQQKRAKQ